MNVDKRLRDGGLSRSDVANLERRLFLKRGGRKASSSRCEIKVAVATALWAVSLWQSTAGIRPATGGWLQIANAES